MLIASVPLAHAVVSLYLADREGMNAMTIPQRAAGQRCTALTRQYDPAVYVTIERGEKSEVIRTFLIFTSLVISHL
jgi:hypothetical protein